MLPGVHAVLTGEELRQGTEPTLPGVDAPQVTRYPMAFDVTRYAGEWVAAVVAGEASMRGSSALDHLTIHMQSTSKVEHWK
mgnify:CR=1 FL=1